MIEQKIYVGEHVDTTKKKSFDFDKLQHSIYSAKSINDYYANATLDNWMWLNKSKHITNELWRPCQSFPGFMASNFGRIRKNNSICDQYEEKYPNHTSKQEIIPLLKSGARHIGWLCVNAGPRGGARYVYNLVADAWLEYDKTKHWEIHHISNDGYDNSPYNLIPLTPLIHSKIKHWKSGNGEYPGPKHKTLV